MSSMGIMSGINVVGVSLSGCELMAPDLVGVVTLTPRRILVILVPRPAPGVINEIAIFLLSWLARGGGCGSGRGFANNRPNHSGGLVAGSLLLLLLVNLMELLLHFTHLGSDGDIVRHLQLLNVASHVQFLDRSLDKLHEVHLVNYRAVIKMRSRV
mmetsp:Transcript_18118/g.21287  ORF Transcript_18118/g.21287 Transcript_18118/m.21287 type:complete len:156 (+) Transcript_18118:676-1143(+)